MTYTITAIETTYAGVNFRSRLEARWAAFFDLVGWHWDYEPLDLRGWIPDFMIKGYRPILVEVKPFFDHGDDVVAITQRKIESAYDGPMEVLLLGATLGWGTCLSEPAIGLLGCRYGLWFCATNDGVDPHWEWENAASQCDGRDFCAEYSGFGHRISGDWDGDHHMVGTDDSKLLALWREAGNRVQWRKSRRWG
jgi:hypothetical protein